MKFSNNGLFQVFIADFWLSVANSPILFDPKNSRFKSSAWLNLEGPKILEAYLNPQNRYKACLAVERQSRMQMTELCLITYGNQGEKNYVRHIGDIGLFSLISLLFLTLESKGCPQISIVSYLFNTHSTRNSFRFLFVHLLINLSTNKIN